MTSHLVADQALLARLEALWERALPALGSTPLPSHWGPTLRALSNRFNRIEGTPSGDYFGADNIGPYFAHHGWAQAASLAAIAAETHLKPLGLELRTQRQRLPKLPDGKPNLVLLGHVLNELAPQDQEELLQRLKARLAPGGAILILEPALMEPTRRLMQLREAFLEAPFALAAPCPCPGPCPMLALDRQWCVSERPWHPPKWFKALDAAAGLDRKHLSFAYLLARRDHPGKNPVARVVGVPKPQKGKVERWMCTPTGGERWEGLTRHGEPTWALPRTSEVALPADEGALKELPGDWKLRRLG